MHTQRNRFPRPRYAAFSLVEVIIALGLAASSIVAILGLFGVGLDRVRESEVRIEAANLATAILGERIAAPYSSLPDSPLPEIDLENMPVSPTEAPIRETIVGSGATVSPSREGRFKLNYRMWRDIATSDSSKLVKVHLILSWPPAAPSVNASRYELITSFQASP